MIWTLGPVQVLLVAKFGSKQTLMLTPTPIRTSLDAGRTSACQRRHWSPCAAHVEGSLMFYYIYSGEFSSFSLIIISLNPELWQYSQFHMTCGQCCNFEMKFGIEMKQWATLWLLNISVFMSSLFPFSWLPLRWITRSHVVRVALSTELHGNDLLCLTL